MLLIDLFEARSEKALDVLSRYLKRPNMFVSFVDIEKLGINPQSQHGSTPLGIYAYPLGTAYVQMKSLTVPFASGRKYICLFQSQGRMLDLRGYTDADYDGDVAALSEYWKFLSPDNEEFAINLLVRWSEDMMSTYHSPGQAIWKLVDRIANRAERLYERDSMVISNSLFRKLGYAGVIDYGESIIHVGEPEQAVFFSRDACRVVEFLVNDHISDTIPPAFPQRGEKKIRGEKPAKSDDDE